MSTSDDQDISYTLSTSVAWLCMQNIWYHIHSFKQIRCCPICLCISCFPTFLDMPSQPQSQYNKTLGLNNNACGKDELARVFYGKVDHIQIQITVQRTHVISTTGVRELLLQGLKNSHLYWSHSGQSTISHAHFCWMGMGSWRLDLISSRCCCQLFFSPHSHTWCLGGLRSLTRLHLCLARIIENDYNYR